MKKILFSSLAIIIIISSLLIYSNMNTVAQSNKPKFEIKLPNPSRTGKMSLEEALAKRRTMRTYLDSAITKQNLAQLLWAAMGATSPQGKRTAPSAGATYPLDLYIVVGNVKDVPQGIYTWSNSSNNLLCQQNGDFRKNIADACHSQEFIIKAPINVIYVANWNRIKPRYEDRSEKYCDQEAGHSAQNLLLEAVTMNCGGCPIGAFDEKSISNILKLDSINQKPMYIITIGRLKSE
jgi:SagB-type dehydrogenase family enzyme